MHKQQRSPGRLLRALAACIVVGMAAVPAPATEQPVTLVYASNYSPGHPFSLADKTWMRWVEEHSGGSLRIRPLWSGSLLSADQSLVELRHGVADIGLITPIYVHGGAHLIRVQSGFYQGADTFEQQVAVYKCLAAAEPEYARELQGLVVLAIQGGALPGVLTRSRAVRTLEDLRGLRLRAPTELLGVLRELGADPVNMPMGEVYSALAKGVLDGVVAPADTLRSLHFTEVAHHFARLKVPRGAYPARAMSLARWQSLSPQQQQVLRESEAVWEAALANETRRSVGAGEEQGLHDGIEFTDVPPAEQARFNDIYQRDAQRNADSLLRLGIDGPPVLARARKLIAGIDAGTLPACNPGDPTR